MPTCASPEESAAAAEEAPWIKINWTVLPYFSKSFASLVIQSGANCPTSLVQTTLISADRDGATILKNSIAVIARTELKFFIRAFRIAAGLRLTYVPAYPYTAEQSLNQV